MRYSKTFKLKEQISINLIDSPYRYNQVKFLVGLIPDLIQKNDYSKLNHKDLSNIGWLIKVMTKFIDSSEMSVLLQKFSQIGYIQMEPNVRALNTKDIKTRSEILSDQMLEWLNNLPAYKQREIYSVEDMRDFFISEFFFNEFIKWLDLVVTDNNITFVELLDAYYSWFPIRPR